MLPLMSPQVASRLIMLKAESIGVLSIRLALTSWPRPAIGVCVEISQGRSTESVATTLQRIFDLALTPAWRARRHKRRADVEILPFQLRCVQSLELDVTLSRGLTHLYRSLVLIIARARVVLQRCIDFCYIATRVCYPVPPPRNRAWPMDNRPGGLALSELSVSLRTIKAPFI